ncbi:hypothetical protein GCM10009688_21560 [Arthrobacter gandavensis]|uniref:Uncharacterized protein n=1 Tax=Arthrobacter gandavensis TaxID=169960 RepID=A0ABN2PCH9_9MICC
MELAGHHGGVLDLGNPDADDDAGSEDVEEDKEVVKEVHGFDLTDRVSGCVIIPVTILQRVELPLPGST